MKSLAVLACVLAALAGDARADGFSWDDATTEVTEDAGKRAAYDVGMAEGDRYARLAAAATSTAVRRKRITAAVTAYENASEALPDEIDPHIRAAEVMFALQINCADCQARGIDAVVARKVLRHWDAFERLAPKDPRVTDLLFERALVRTKHATHDDLVAAVSDYEKLLDRVGTETFNSTRLLSLGNLAESYMMTGNLQGAIERYVEAIALDPKTSFFYGLAVAYDRDEQGAKSREIIRALGDTQFELWAREVERGDTFYVPDGEVFYYFALVRQALDDTDGAIVAWERYLDSGAHPEYQPRAREHKAALEAAKAAGTAKQKKVEKKTDIREYEW